MSFCHWLVLSLTYERLASFVAWFVQIGVILNVNNLF